MKNRILFSGLICSAVLALSSIQASAYWLEYKGNEKSPFGKDLRIGSKGSDASRIVEIIFSDQFDFSEFSGIGVIIGEPGDNATFFSGALLLMELGDHNGKKPNRMGTGFTMSSAVMKKCEFGFETKYRGKWVGVRLTFEMKNGEPVGYKLEVKEFPEADKKNTK